MTAIIDGQHDLAGNEHRIDYMEKHRIRGTHEDPVNLGGKKPQSATITITCTAEVDGFFRKGDRITGTFEAVVRSVGSKDKIDKPTGQVVESVQTHTAQVVVLHAD